MKPFSKKSELSQRWKRCATRDQQGCCLPKIKREIEYFHSLLVTQITAAQDTTI